MDNPEPEQPLSLPGILVRLQLLETQAAEERAARLSLGTQVKEEREARVKLEEQLRNRKTDIEGLKATNNLLKDKLKQEEEERKALELEFQQEVEDRKATGWIPVEVVTEPSARFGSWGKGRWTIRRPSFCCLRWQWKYLCG